MDTLRFDNTINYMVVNEFGKIVQQGNLKNTVGARTKDLILQALTTPSGTNVGTLAPIRFIGFRTDGSAILGSYAQWYNSQATAFSTRYNSGTYLTSVGFNATYTATTTTTVKAVVLQSNLDTSRTSDDVGSFCMFYSTSLVLTAGSANNIIINWTVGVS